MPLATEVPDKLTLWPMCSPADFLLENTADGKGS